MPNPEPSSNHCYLMVFLSFSFKQINFILFIYFYYFIYYYFIYLFLAALGLRCCMQAFSSCSERGLLFVAVGGLLIAVASLAARHGF